MTSQDKLVFAIKLLEEVAGKCDRGQFFNEYPKNLQSFDELIANLQGIELHPDIDKVQS